ncbi:hypothetical protein L6164_000902 [Bauhinia variegata]|uniref:Uncharacterized protein n=1 Tax=Bauhinia variegata TaxID=167791 RepID=A0ACB9Q7W6_BAUVA|nr:hypothetical protein L6164_000902 [Bauhinia variegata]
MDKHENRFKNENEKVKRWKSALNEAANLSGSTYRTGYEFEFITKIIKDGSSKLLHKLGKLGMHDLIQDMGKEVVKQDASSKLGEYSRLWNHEDIVDVLTTNSGSDSIQGIMFDPPKRENNFEKVTYMNFSGCTLLTQVPDLSRVPNVTILGLERCTSLIEVHDSVGVNTKLKKLSLEGCTNLRIFPRGIKMRSLERLDLRGCRSLQHFPDILEEMVNLTCILAILTGIKEIPHSICYLPRLEALFVSHCCELVSLPGSISQLHTLESLDLVGCTKLHQFPRAPPNLGELELNGCRSLTLQSLNSLFSQNFEKAIQAVKPLAVYMPRIHIPNWFDYRCKGGRLSFWASEKYVCKFTFAAVFKTSISQISSRSYECVYMDITRRNNGIWTSCRVACFGNGSGTIFLQFVDYSNINIHDWNHVEIECRSLPPEYKEDECEIDECGVYMYKEDIKMEDIRFECPIPSNSNMDTVMSKNDEEPRDMIEEAEPWERSFCDDIHYTF